MTRIRRVGMNNITRINNIKFEDRKRVNESFKKKIMEIEQEQIREELKILLIRLKPRREGLGINCSLRT